MSQRVVECVPNFSEGRDMAQDPPDHRRHRGRVRGEAAGRRSRRRHQPHRGHLRRRSRRVVEAAFRRYRPRRQADRHAPAPRRAPAHGRHRRLPLRAGRRRHAWTTAPSSRGAGRARRQRAGDPGLPLRTRRQPARSGSNLAVVRKGEYEGLEEKLQDPEWKPDFGPATFHPKAGALITGAREFLIAYNITLNSRDKAHATDIAFELREKGRVARRGQKSAYYSSGQDLRYAGGRVPLRQLRFRRQDASRRPSAHCHEAHGYRLRELLAANDIDAAKGVVGQKVYRAGRFKAVQGHRLVCGRLQAGPALHQPDQLQASPRPGTCWRRREPWRPRAAWS